MRFLLIPLLLLGCGVLHKAPGVYTEVEEFKIYTDEYLVYKKKYLGIDKVNYAIDIVFSQYIDFPTVGQCYRTDDQTAPREISVSQEYWKNKTDVTKLELIMHEMGHCDLNYEHQEDVSGIMNPYLRNKILTDTVIEAFFLEAR